MRRLWRETLDRCLKKRDELMKELAKL